MFPETEKKLAAMSVEDKRAAERWVELNTNSKSLASFIEGVESKLNRPLDTLDSMVKVGALLFKAGVAEGYSDPEFVYSV